MFDDRHYDLPVLKDYVKNSLQKFSVPDSIIEICTSDEILEDPENFPMQVVERPQLVPVFLAQKRISEIYPLEPLIDITAKRTAEKVIPTPR